MRHLFRDATKMVCALLLLGMLAGCTKLTVTKQPDGTSQVTYYTALQNRSFSLTKTGENEYKVEYSTSNDPVVQLAKDLSSLAAVAANGK